MGSREQNTEKSIFREIGGLALYLTAILVVSYLVLHYVGQRTTVSGMSMYPALEDGDNLLVDKLTYRFRDPERFDIIVFPFRFQEETYYIKRIIGLPGETVQIADGCVFIDGVRLADDLDVEIENPGLAAVPLTLGEDEYFVLGDNRNDSSDSRDPAVGLVHRTDIIGRAVFRIWPLGGFGTLSRD